MKKTWMTEIAMMLTALGGSFYAVSEIPNLGVSIVMWMKALGVGLGTIGGSLLGYRGSKKLGELKK